MTPPEVYEAVVDWVAGSLYKAVQPVADRVRKSQKKQLPRYEYDPHVATAARLSKVARRGIDWACPESDCYFIRALDSQRKAKKTIFGAGYLLSDRAAQAKTAAEQAAAREVITWELSDREKEIVWELSDREKAIVDQLGDKH